MEIVSIDEEQHLGEDLPLRPGQLGDVVPLPDDQRKVGSATEFVVPGVGADQRRQVLALVGPLQRENQRFLRLAQKPVDLAGDFGQLVAPSGRAESIEIDPGRNDQHPARRAPLVLTPLLLHLLIRARDDQIRRREDLLLGGDAAAHAVALLDGLRRRPFVEQPLLLALAQRVPGVDEGCVEQSAQPHRDGAGVGVVAVDDVGNPLDPAEVLQHLVGELRQIRPQ